MFVLWIILLQYTTQRFYSIFLQLSPYVFEYHNNGRTYTCWRAFRLVMNQWFNVKNTCIHLQNVILNNSELTVKPYWIIFTYLVPRCMFKFCFKFTVQSVTQSKVQTQITFFLLSRNTLSLIYNNFPTAIMFVLLLFCFIVCLRCFGDFVLFLLLFMQWFLFVNECYSATVVWNDYLLIFHKNIIIYFTKRWQPSANNQIRWIILVSTNFKTFSHFCWKFIHLKAV